MQDFQQSQAVYTGIKSPSAKTIKNFDTLITEIHQKDITGKLHLDRGYHIPNILGKRLRQSYGLPPEYDDKDQLVFEAREQFESIGPDWLDCCALSLLRYFECQEKKYPHFYLSSVLGCKPLPDPAVVVSLLKKCFDAYKKYREKDKVDQKYYNHTGPIQAQMRDLLESLLFEETSELKTVMKEIQTELLAESKEVINFQIREYFTHETSFLIILKSFLMKIVRDDDLTTLLSAYRDFPKDFFREYYLRLDEMHPLLPKPMIDEIIKRMIGQLNKEFLEGAPRAVSYLQNFQYIPSSIAFVRCLDDKFPINESIKMHILRYAVPDTSISQEQVVAALKDLPEGYRRGLSIYSLGFSNIIAGTLGIPEYAELAHWLNIRPDNDDICLPKYMQIRDVPPSTQGIESLRRISDKLGEKAIKDTLSKMKAIKPSFVKENSDFYERDVSRELGHRKAEISKRFYYLQAAMGWNRDDVLKSFEKLIPNACIGLGMLPIGKKSEILQRYKQYKEKYKEIISFGIQRQSTLKNAFERGLNFLALQAGYDIYLKFEWNIEAELERSSGKSVLKLEFSEDGYKFAITMKGARARITAYKDDKEMRSIPQRFKKNPKFLELQSTQEILSAKSKDFKQAFEKCMAEMIPISSDELNIILKNPAAHHQLSNLYLQTSLKDEDFYWLDKDILRSEKKEKPLKDIERIYIAHPYNILRAGKLVQFQKRILKEGIIQPFKQIFREIYILTEKERNKRYFTRYAKLDVNGLIAARLLVQRGYRQKAINPARKYYSDFKIFAYISFEETVYYLEQSLSPATMDAVFFSEKEEDWPLKDKGIPLDTVAPIILSETLRDADLIATVAGTGIEKWASAQSVEFRGNLISELFTNDEAVCVLGNTVEVQGKLNKYSINLKNSETRLLPEEKYVCVVPKESLRKNKSKIYLPFEEDDMMLNLIISKILLFRNDEDIKDGIIKRQIS